MKHLVGSAGLLAVLSKMNHCRASCIELSYAQGACHRHCASRGSCPSNPCNSPNAVAVSQLFDAQRDLQARSSTMRRWSVAEEIGMP